jgi:hypothetical protein
VRSAVREGFLKLDNKAGKITNAHDETLFLRRNRKGEEIYVAPSTETAICAQVTKKEVWVCVDWEGAECTSWKECSSKRIIEVEICVNYAVEELRNNAGPYRPSDDTSLAL